jgi:hypothetical protein
MLQIKEVIEIGESAKTFVNKSTLNRFLAPQ